MNFIGELSKVRESMTKKDIRDRAEKLSSFYELASQLKTCKFPNEVLQYLVAEIEEKNRPSYIRRIYGYYHKILPLCQLEEIRIWARRANKV